MIHDRATIIFGNGLGMAIDEDFFNLKSALKQVWNNSENVKDSHKKLIRTALPEMSSDAFPESEDMLDKLQKAIVAAEVLREFENVDVSWLNDESRDIPDAFRRYVHEVALYFHSSAHKLPSEFSVGLAKFLEKTSSHVAVLNYDNLLYDALCDLKILNGYSGILIDGFTNKVGFDASNLNRSRETLGWFMHLHGSPLFIDNHKERGAGRDFLAPSSECHIVLTHVKHKPLLIDRSKILSEYWSRLTKAIKESSAVIMFGYSGGDIHLNEIVSAQGSGKRIYIVEWAGSGSQYERLMYWEDQLDMSGVTVIQMDNILQFKDWNLVKEVERALYIPF